MSIKSTLSIALALAALTVGSTTFAQAAQRHVRAPGYDRVQTIRGADAYAEAPRGFAYGGNNQWQMQSPGSQGFEPDLFSH